MEPQAPSAHSRPLAHIAGGPSSSAGHSGSRLGWCSRACATFHLPRATTSMESAQTVLPATLVSNFLVIETAGRQTQLLSLHCRYRLVGHAGDPDLVKRFGGSTPGQPDADAGARRQRRSEAAQPGHFKTPASWARRALKGFGRSPTISPICPTTLAFGFDGVLGFPLFRQTPADPRLPPVTDHHQPPTACPLRNPASPSVQHEQNTPLIPIQLGAESLVALVDSGSDAPLSLNTVGLHPTFLSGPKPGVLMATLAGDRIGNDRTSGPAAHHWPYVFENPMSRHGRAVLHRRRLAPQFHRSPSTKSGIR